MCERLNRGGGMQQSGFDFFSLLSLSFYQTLYLIFETTFISTVERSQTNVSKNERSDVGMKGEPKTVVE